VPAVKLSLKPVPLPSSSMFCAKAWKIAWPGWAIPVESKSLMVALARCYSPAPSTLLLASTKPVPCRKRPLAKHCRRSRVAVDRAAHWTFCVSQGGLRRRVLFNVMLGSSPQFGSHVVSFSSVQFSSGGRDRHSSPGSAGGDHDQRDQLPVTSTKAAIKAFVVACAAMASTSSPRR